MIKIDFVAESDFFDLSKAVSEYRSIWQKEGKKIITTIERISGLKFKETQIQAVVFQARLPSRSYPLSLKANIFRTQKISELIHELTHRVLSGNGIGPNKKIKNERGKQLEVHKALDLVLYDIWEELYGQKFADVAVKTESKDPVYKKAWQWALSFDKRKRQQKFAKYVNYF